MVDYEAPLQNYRIVFLFFSMTQMKNFSSAGLYFGIAPYYKIFILSTNYTPRK